MVIEYADTPMFTVLLPVDEETDRNMAVAEYVTRLPNSEESVEVIVLSVLEEFNYTGSSGEIRSEEFYDENTLPDSATAVVKYLEDHNVSVTAQREHGKPPAQILEAAEKFDVDTIVMGGRERTPVGKALFGSVSQRVMLSADCPVTMIMEKSNNS